MLKILALLLPTLLACCSWKGRANHLDDNILSEQNSRFVEARDYRGVVWAIVQARVTPPKHAVGGFCATAWPIQVSSTSIVFVSAMHAISEDLFEHPDAAYTLVGLSDGSTTIHIFPWELIRGENDVGFIIVPVKRLPPETILHAIKFDEVSYPVGKRVYNLGFPNRANTESHLVLDFNPFGLTYNSGPWLQSGHVLRIGHTSVNSLDVKMINSRVLILDFASERGFSGGPLFLENSDLAIGMMSMVIPKRGSAPTESLAISASEIRRQERKYLPNLSR